MAINRNTTGNFSVTAYRGDAKTLLAFDFSTTGAPKGLAGFTVQVTPPSIAPYYLLNDLKFADPTLHAQVPGEEAYSSANAPLHKFRWVHVPGSAHQGLTPAYGAYTYTVTPRFFSSGKLKKLDPALSVTIAIDVAPYAAGNVKVGFTRGFVQSQAYVRHFGPKALIRPPGTALQFDTALQAGIAPGGTPFSWAEQYAWLGFTARTILFELLDEVERDPGLTVDLCAYDLNEPDFVAALLKIGARLRIILDDAPLHHDKNKPTREDAFETLFTALPAPGHIQRGSFGRYAHDKVLIVKRAGQPIKVLTGSTNFSVTGLYVNSNHVLLFDEPSIAATYAAMFDEAWRTQEDRNSFAASAIATQDHSFAPPASPPIVINFSPHSLADARSVLGEIVDRINAEEKAPAGKRSVLFAVMQMTGGKDNPVYDVLNALHARETVYSYGISDTARGIALYQVGQKTGVLVTGKPSKARLPPPFNQVPDIGIGHQIHHKFVVCGFNGPDPVVFCGSSNLALAGEQDNGDNLLAIHDEGIATVFAIEAIALVDHFEFLDRMDAGKPAKDIPPPAVKREGAVAAGWFLGTSDRWAAKYFDPTDLHSVDRVLFGGPPPAAASLQPAFFAARVPRVAALAGGPTQQEIEDTVGSAIQKLVETETRATFSWSLVPSKDLSDGGLGVRANAWSGLLGNLKAKYLPQSSPYAEISIDNGLVDATLDKSLRSLKSEVVKRVVAAGSNA